MTSENSRKDLTPRTWLSKTIETITANTVAWTTIATLSGVDPEEELRRLEHLQQGWARQNLGRLSRPALGNARSSPPAKGRRSQRKALTPTTSLGLIKGFTARTRLHGDDFDRLQEAGRVKLESRHRKRVQRLLRAYELLRHGVVVRPRMPKGEAIARGLGKIIEMIEADRDRWSKVAERSEVNLEEELPRLERLRQNCGRLRSLNRRGRKPDDLMLPGLLFGLESVFVDAGGTARGIAHTDYGEREGPFLNFMYQALHHLPEGLRPRSKQALGSRWERIYQKRKKDGDPAFHWATNEHHVQLIASLAS
jgi:hypothetical protein